ncbi:2-phosphosulfolactate phosphatase [Lentibacillus sp. Marseille-P4043]|uniref:2-phosphosulfolactate phosphatase n=1 Tax=Lentibacillus sp. Marseille-P4043 TaxID=2040293 RepID=UPI0018F8A689|nr:2-phosphosulfolactate phosphatase [Lentibacillus sp. Marseille-P4043]
MKIHLLLKKEEVDTVQMDENKIAVVFDVLLATSTITACLDYGARQVIPVMDEAEALKEAKNFSQEDISLVGEYDGKTIDGFLDPAPLALKEHVAAKTVVLSTTNGTVAIRKAASAKEVYIASLLNGRAVSKQIADMYDNETIIVVCSGSKNQFCLEDFYGAGYFIDQLVNAYGGQIDLTDSALTAKLFYENVSDQAVLRDSRVGKMLENYGFEDDIAYVNQRGILSVIPRLVDGKTIMEERRQQ